MTTAAIEQAILTYLADGQPRTLRQVQCALGPAVLPQRRHQRVNAIEEAGKVERVNGGVVRMKDEGK